MTQSRIKDENEKKKKNPDQADQRRRAAITPTSGNQGKAYLERSVNREVKSWEEKGENGRRRETKK